MANLHALGRHELIAPAVVLGLDLRVGGHVAQSEFGRIENHDGVAAFLGDFEIGFVSFVVSLHFGVRRFGFLLELRGGEERVLEFDLLVLVAEFGFHVGGGDDDALGDDLFEFVDEQLARGGGFQVRESHALLLQHGGEGGAVDFAILNQLGRQGVDDRAVDFLRGDFQADAVGFKRHGALIDELLHNLRRIDGEHFRRQLAVAGHVLNGAGYFLGGDFFFPDLGDEGLIGRRAADAAAGTGNQIGDHGKSDKAQHHRQQDAHGLFAAAEQIEHFKGSLLTTNF